MARIIKVGPHTVTPNKAANPFKTSRTSTTNPFKYANFEGNTLQFADVFEGFEPKNTNKLKMIASSVAGSMYKVRSSIVEPVSAFVRRIGSGISGAWNYAKNTNISDLPVISNMNSSLKGMGETISGRISAFGDSFANIGKGISAKTEFLNTDITEVGKYVSEKWTSLVSKYSTPKISSDMPVAELEAMLKAELEGAVA